ncbi:MAG: site-specific integrase, partial [Candidatus Bathyarchaeota archaeon]
MKISVVMRLKFRYNITQSSIILMLIFYSSGGIVMTELRQRMTEDLQLRGMSQRSQEMYVRAVRQLAEHYRKSPDKITEEELRDYFLYVRNEKKWSRATS